MTLKTTIEALKHNFKTYVIEQQDRYKYADVPQGYRPSLIAGFTIIIVFFAWAGLSPIEEHVRGTGRIIPSGKARIIQHLEGGIISSILIREGQSVEEGQTLFTINNKRAESSLNEIQIDLQSLEIRKLRLLAELEDKDELVFTEEQIKNYAAIIESEKQLFESRHQEIVQRLSGLKEKLKQKELRLSELNSQVSNLKKEVAVAREQLSIKESLYKAGATSRSQYLEAQSILNNFNTRIEQVKKEIPIVIAEHTEISNNLQETKQNWISAVNEDLSAVNIDIKKFTERMHGMTDEVQRTAIKSPVKGVVNKIYINTLGGVIQPGAQLAEIIPIDETLIIEGRINTDDRGKIYPGLPVNAKITAYDYTIYGSLKGKLTYISADSLIDQRNQEFYRIRVELESEKLDMDKPVFPGMTADLNIMVGQTTILHAILKPFLQIKENAFREL